jgi:hypothetical protein
MFYYGYITIIIKLLYNLKHVEYYYHIYSIFAYFSKKKDLNDKYIEDPFLYRNTFLKLYTNIDYYINLLKNTNYFIKKKEKYIIFLFFLLDKFIKIYLLKIFNKKISYNVIKLLYNNFITLTQNIIKKKIYIFFFLLYFMLLNFIYNLIKISIYIVFFFIKIIYNLIKKNTIFAKFIITILLLFYFH